MKTALMCAGLLLLGQQLRDFNTDGSLKPSRPVTAYFTQDAYTEYALLEPGSESFRIRYLTEERRAGATELVNATRGGSEGSDVEVYDPRTGKPAKFTYGPAPNDPETHEIRATLPIPVPEGGIGRVLIYKTYKDPRTYMMDGKNIVWVRSLAGYRLGVILPKGYAFTSSNVATQMTTTSDGRLKLAFANPSGMTNFLTINAHPTTATFTPSPFDDMFFDDMKTLYDLGEPGSGKVDVEQIYSDYRKGSDERLDSLDYLWLIGLKVIDLDTAKPLGVVTGGVVGGVGRGKTPATKSDVHTLVHLDVPITDDRQSAHLKITGTLAGDSYRVENDGILFQHVMKGLRNTIVLPKGWEVSSVSQSGTIGTDRNGRTFVALVNLNAENNYNVTIRARKAQ
jgi:hypothetical protein